MSQESISLYFSEGSSDKEYHAQILPQGDGYVVNFRYGRRGSTLTGGTKTSSPIPLNKAKAIYDKLVKEKTAKGYSPGTAGNAYQATALEARFTGLVPQLLNPITADLLDQLLDDPAYAMQEKCDGKRTMLRRTAEGVEGSNRKGLIIALPQLIVADALRLSAPCVLDGELIGETFHVFDLLESREGDMRPKPYLDRVAALEQLLTRAGLGRKGVIKAVPVYLDQHKRSAFDRIRAARGEGVVFKLIAAPYTSGRPASGGAQLKHKFVASATVRVAALNKTKRSVAIELQEPAGGWVFVGNVSIPVNQIIPKIGDLIEVEYLYAHKGGSLFQPIFRGLREDLDIAACIVTQLKYKADSSGDEDA